MGCRGRPPSTTARATAARSAAGGTAPPEGCPFADTDTASPNHAAYRNDLLRTRAGGTLGAQTLDAKFRLLSESRMQIKTREDLNPGQNFLFSLGQVLYDINVGRNGAGEIVIDTGSSGSIRGEPVGGAGPRLQPAGARPRHRGWARLSERQQDARRAAQTGRLP